MKTTPIYVLVSVPLLISSRTHPHARSILVSKFIWYLLLSSSCTNPRDHPIPIVMLFGTELYDCVHLEPSYAVVCIRYPFRISKFGCLNEIFLDGSKEIFYSNILCFLNTMMHFIPHALRIMRMKSFP
jgi:hypothetical protein